MVTTLASSITKAASQQTYYTIRLLADRDRMQDAYRAYAYFRWVDDVLDAASGSSSERKVFLERQKSLLEACYRGEPPRDVDMQENMLVELVQHDHEKNSGLKAYLTNMMLVMDFDTRRRGRTISQTELSNYTRWLAIAVTESLHYFIGHDDTTPHDRRRYLAVSAAHVAHMLRDTADDMQVGYYNTPDEVLKVIHIGPQDMQSQAYHTWVRSRAQLAREYFKAGKEYFAQVQSLRCRLAGIAYIVRFEWVLDTIEREGFSLRAQYNERKGLEAGLQIGWLTVSTLFNLRPTTAFPPAAISHPLEKS